jgi:hypothetical protein
LGGRFEKTNIKMAGVEVFHFSTPDQLPHWIKANENILTNTLFLIDYEFLGFEQVGLDIIENLGIQSQSILITSHYEEIGIKQRCERLGVQLIPKDMAAFVPITIKTKNKIDAILIDNDDLIRVCWEQVAKIKQKAVVLFSTVEEFMRVSNTFKKDTPIYVDVNLSNGIRGEEVAKELSALGFCNLYLATGYDPANFSNLPFIKGVIDKYPPF